MSTRDALIQRIDQQPEWVLKQMHTFLDAFVDHTSPNQGNEGWPSGYFEATAGAFSSEPFEKPHPLAFDKREEW